MNIAKTPSRQIFPTQMILVVCNASQHIHKTAVPRLAPIENGISIFESCPVTEFERKQSAYHVLEAVKSFSGEVV